MILDQDDLIKLLVANIYLSGGKLSLKSTTPLANHRLSKQIKTNSPPKKKQMEFSNYSHAGDDMRANKQLSMYDYPNKQISYQSNNNIEESKELDFEGGDNEDDPDHVSDISDELRNKGLNKLPSDKDSSMSGMNDLNMNIKNSGIPEEDYLKYTKLEAEDIQELKLLMKKNNPKLMSYLLQIAMGLGEEKLC